MVEAQLFAAGALGLIGVGLFGILRRRNLIRILLALNILSTGVNLLMISTGRAEGPGAPVLQAAGANRFVGGQEMPLAADPLPQAMTLMAMVIQLGITALALGLTLRYFKAKNTLKLGRDSAAVGKNPRAVGKNPRAAGKGPKAGSRDPNGPSTDPGTQRKEPT